MDNLGATTYQNPIQAEHDKLRIFREALAHIGDVSTISSTKEDSTQAMYCQLFWQSSLDYCLSQNAWRFATQTAELAKIAITSNRYDYVYSVPQDCIKILEFGVAEYLGANAWESWIPQSIYELEHIIGYGDVLLSDTDNGSAKYITRNCAIQYASPTFRLMLSHHLASMIAGPIIKGTAGAREAEQQLKLVQFYQSAAIDKEVNESAIVRKPRVPAVLQARK